ncbi:hypothetical protein BHE74_00020140 [Ensete ventricosum]|nr:hypothetical protein BHE74_00020140 [Ensete ventricosum]
MKTSWVEKTSNVSISGGRSCNPIPRQWKELCTEAMATEGTVHASYTIETFGLLVDGRGSVGQGFTYRCTDILSVPVRYRYQAIRIVHTAR